MKTTQITYNKITTVITEENGISNVTTIKTRKATFEFLNTLECFAMKVSNNIDKVVSKIEALGFEVSIDEDYGFEWEAKIYATK